MAERRQRNARHQTALMALARMDVSGWDAALRTITEVDAAALDVHRVSVWLFNEDGSEILCENLYDARDDRHEKAATLRAADYPRYFQALQEKRSVAASDACRDPDTREFTQRYLKPLGITSMLDVPVWHHGKVVGIVCHEHTGPRRRWTAQEQDFAASVADVVARALEAAERRRILSPDGRTLQVNRAWEKLYVTERRQAEKEVRESEERFKSAFERSSIGMSIVGLDDRFLQVNRAACALFGYSAEEMRSLTTASISHPDDLRELRKTSDDMRRLLSGEIASFQVEKRYRHKRGHYFWGLIGVSLVRDAEGNPLHFISQVQDITEQKRAEEALRRAHDELEARVAERTAELARANAALQAEIAERKRAEQELLQKTSELQAVFQALPDLYFRLDPDGTILDYQAGHGSSLYVAPREFLGKRMQDVLPPDVNRPFWRRPSGVSAARGESACIEYPLARPGARPTSRRAWCVCAAIGAIRSSPSCATSIRSVSRRRRRCNGAKSTSVC